MKKQQTATDLQIIINLQKPDYDNSLSNLPSQDKIKFRRSRINRLRIRGYTNEAIAHEIGSSISTVEKDLKDIRKQSKQWYEKESITDFCKSLYDSIILCDNAIEDLQILYSECDDLDSKIQILNTMSDFEERKTDLYVKTRVVGEYHNKNITEGK